MINIAEKMKAIIAERTQAENPPETLRVQLAEVKAKVEIIENKLAEMEGAP